VVVAAVEAVGTVLVIALIVVPAAAARLLTDRVAAMTILACLLGAAAGWLGLAVSFEVSVDHDLRLAAGATIVVVLVGLFLVAAAMAPLRRLPFFTMALGHATFPGVVLAALAGISLFAGAAAFGAVVVVVVALLGARERVDDTSAVGVTLSGRSPSGCCCCRPRPGSPGT
jgi:ABC-type Mn2+/Zn2+ transport system permease subunit